MNEEEWTVVHSLSLLSTSDSFADKPSFASSGSPLLGCVHVCVGHCKLLCKCPRESHDTPSGILLDSVSYGAAPAPSGPILETRNSFCSPLCNEQVFHSGNASLGSVQICFNANDQKGE